MANKIYTIGREFGSGGREVGEKLAAKLGIKLYEKNFYSRLQKTADSVKRSLRIMMKNRQTVFYIL